MRRAAAACHEVSTAVTAGRPYGNRLGNVRKRAPVTWSSAMPGAGSDAYGESY